MACDGRVYRLWADQQHEVHERQAKSKQAEAQALGETHGPEKELLLVATPREPGYNTKMNQDTSSAVSGRRSGSRQA